MSGYVVATAFTHKRAGQCLLKADSEAVRLKSANDNCDIGRGSIDLSLKPFCRG